MNKWRWLSFLFIFFSFGAVQETYRILTSPDADIAENRTFLIPMALILTSLILFAAIYFWIKSNKQ